MKLRLSTKTPYQKKLDRRLFEAVGNGDRHLQRYAIPNLTVVKQHIRNGATVDHFIFFSSPGQDDEIFSMDYKNAIDNAMKNKTPAGFEVLKELISAFPGYRESFIPFENGNWAASLLHDAFYDHHVLLAIHLIGLGREEHPFFTFFPYAFENDFYDDKSQEFSEKISILDAINSGYNFVEKFKSDYEILKQRGFIDHESNCQEHKLTIKNLIVFNKYVLIREMSPKELFGELEYDRLKGLIPELTQTVNCSLQ